MKPVFQGRRFCLKKEPDKDTEENFKFNVDMVATAKAVKESGDESFTLGDLLDIYYGTNAYAAYISATGSVLSAV